MMLCEIDDASIKAKYLKAYIYRIGPADAALGDDRWPIEEKAASLEYHAISLYAIAARR